MVGNRLGSSGLLAAFGAALAVATVLLWAASAESAPRQAFDLQAHRGGLGLRPESTLSAFGNAMQLGVSTLELDVQITEDGVAVVTHDRQISPIKCQDTAPAFSGDPEYPYVGKYIKTLSLAQVKTLDCGTRRPTDPNDPYVKTMEMVPGSKMPTLTEVFDLVKRYGADGVKLNVETKVEAGAPEETAPREQFVQVVANDVREAGMLDQVTIQSFDWGALMRMREVEPRLPIVALTNRGFLQCGQPGASPWLGGIDADDYDCDLVRAADSFGADAISPVHGFPQNGTVGDPSYEPYVTSQMVDEAHAAGMKVIPWTVNRLPRPASRGNGRPPLRATRARYLTVRRAGPPRRKNVQAREYPGRLRLRPEEPRRLDPRARHRGYRGRPTRRRPRPRGQPTRVQGHGPRLTQRHGVSLRRRPHQRPYAAPDPNPRLRLYHPAEPSKAAGGARREDADPRPGIQGCQGEWSPRRQAERGDQDQPGGA
jgi:glycerophosphoryl diester phosphodiesterase